MVKVQIANEAGNKNSFFISFENLKKLAEIKPFYFFILLCIPWIIFKIPHLSLPFYWDEAWVYGKAARMMADKGISMMPDSLPLEIGRGHPLLFHATTGLFLQVFGNTVFNAHLLALIITFFTLLSVFLFSEKFFGRWSGVFAAAILLPQPVFLAQSSHVLPEMALGLFVLLALRFFLEKRVALYLISATAAILIKESAIVLFAALSFVSLLDFIRSKNTFTQLIKQVSIINLPLLGWGLHLLSHKFQFGSYFFHVHADYISFNPAEMFGKMQRGFYYTFLAHGRNILFVFLVLAGGWIFFRKLSARNLKLVIPAIASFVLLFLIFTSMNYLAERYLLVLIIFSAVFSSAVIITAFQHSMVRLLLAVTCVSVSLFFTIKFPTVSDHTLGYVDAVRAYEQTCSFLKENVSKSDTIYAYFNLREAITNKEAGYMEESGYFKNISHYPVQECRYFVFSSVENADELEKYSGLYNLQRIKRIDEGIVWVEIMKKPD